MSSTGTPKTTLFLADDEESIRRTLREFFAELPDYRIVGEACDGMEAVEGCKKARPDVALLDIQMPVLDGIGAAKLILAERSAKCVIMLTAFSDQTYVQEALEAGAFGYLTKPFQPEQGIPPALQRAPASEPAVPGAL